MKVAIVGRRNTGKSTFVNTLVQAERMIVSEIPARRATAWTFALSLMTERSSRLTRPAFVANGLNRRTILTFYGAHRALRSIRRADVVFLFSTVPSRIGKIDKQLGDYITQQHNRV